MKKNSHFLIVGFVVVILIITGYIANAGSEHNVSGFAWSENIGWISFNNTSGGGAVSYGVNINQTTGNFSGYAWSENIGWIQFNPSGPYPTSPDYSVKVDLATKQITGWARALAFGDGWDGWIKFGYGTGGTYIDSNGDFQGWAWGSDVVGWISLNHANTGGSLYKVQTSPPAYLLAVSKSGAGTGSGTITAPIGTGDGINCGTNCTENYASGASIALTPVPSSESFFAGWSGDDDCSDGNVTMNISKNCIATFNLSPPDFILKSSNLIFATIIQSNPAVSNSTTISATSLHGFNGTVGPLTATSDITGASYKFSPTNTFTCPGTVCSSVSFSITVPPTTTSGPHDIIVSEPGGRSVIVKLNVEVFNLGWKEF